MAVCWLAVQRRQNCTLSQFQFAIHLSTFRPQSGVWQSVWCWHSHNFLVPGHFFTSSPLAFPGASALLQAAVLLGLHQTIALHRSLLWPVGTNAATWFWARNTLDKLTEIQLNQILLLALVLVQELVWPEIQLKNTIKRYWLTSQFHRLARKLFHRLFSHCFIVWLENWQKYFHRLAIAMQQVALRLSLVWPLCTRSVILMNWDEFCQSKKSEEKSAKYQLHWLSYIDELYCKCTPMQFFIAKADSQKI